MEFLTGEEDGRPDGTMETSLEQEIDMVRSLLENDSLESQTGRDKLLHELARIRLRQEERLQSALSSKKSLQQVRINEQMTCDIYTGTTGGV